MLKHYPKQTFPLVGARFVERAGYYGLRSIILLFAMDRVGLKEAEAFRWYALITFLTYISQFLGAFLVDLLLKPKLSILIGGGLQVIGTLFFISPEPLSFKIGAIVFAIGSGLYSTTMLSSFGRLYFDKVQSANSGFLLFFGLATAASMLGAVWWSELPNVWSYTAAFILISLSFAGTTMLSYKNVTNELPRYQKNKKSSIFTSTFSLTFAVVAVVLIMCSMELIIGILFRLTMFDSTGTRPNSTPINTAEYECYAIGIVTILLFILWHFVQLSNFLKMALGFIFGAIVIYSSMIALESTHYYPLLIGINLFLCAVTETLIIPAVLVIYMQFTNPKYLSIVMGTSFFLVYILIHFIGDDFRIMFDDNIKLQPFLKILAILFLIMATIAVLFHRFVKQRPFIPADDAPEAADLIDYKSGEILD